MKVGDRLGDPVVRRHETSVGLEAGLHGAGNPLARLHHLVQQIGRAVVERFDMRPRHHERVTRKHGPGIQERRHVGLVEDPHGIPLAGHDLAEGAGRHPRNGSH
jgi:hypothetical protein